MDLNECARFIRVVMIYYIGLFVLEMSGCLNLYGQNIIRRLINMGRRLDDISYQDKLDPYCHHRVEFLDAIDIDRLRSIQLRDDVRDTPFLTRKHTSTHQCCESFTEEEIRIMTDIRDICKKKYEHIIGRPLFYFPKDMPSFYIYHGDKAHHSWHVDPRNVDHIYNLILCVDCQGEISPFQYKDKDGNIHSFETQIGDAILFRGGTTVHQIPPNNDPTSKRTVLSLQFTTIPLNKQNPENIGTMCSFIEGGKNHKNVAFIALVLFGLNFFLSYLSRLRYEKISFSIYLYWLFFCLVMNRYIPCRIKKWRIGTGRCTSIVWNCMWLFLFICTTISIKGAIILFSYFLLTDILLPSLMVAYD